MIFFIQVLQLKQNQVDYESMKLESKRLQADVEELNAELEELSNLKTIVEKDLEEALNSLQQEREQKHAFKKELDQRITHESVFNLQNLANLGFGLGLGDVSKHADGHNYDQDSNEISALRKIEADFSEDNSPRPGAPNMGKSPVGDLFSEVHVTEVRKLEKLLEDTNLEKGKLQKALEDAYYSLEVFKTDIEEQKEKIAQMKAHITSVTALHSGSDVCIADYDEEISLEDSDSDADPEILAMKKNLRQKDRSYAAALKQISELQEQIAVLEHKLGGDKENEDDLKDEITKLKNKLSVYEESIKTLTEVSVICDTFTCLF